MGRVRKEFPAPIKYQCVLVPVVWGILQLFLGYWFQESERVWEHLTICKEQFVTRRAMRMSGKPRHHPINLDRRYGSPPSVYVFRIESQVESSSFEIDKQINLVSFQLK